MTPDTTIGAGGVEVLETHQPRIYLPENLITRNFPKSVETSKHRFKTWVVLPVKLNGMSHDLPVVPILSEYNKIVGYMCWFDPRNGSLAHDTAVDLSKLAKERCRGVKVFHSIESNKSGPMTYEAAELTGEDFIRNSFGKCTAEEAVLMMEKHPDFWASLYTKITSGDQEQGMFLDDKQVELIQKFLANEQVVLDDIFSTGGTGNAARRGIVEVKARSGEVVDPESILIFVGGLEVLDKVLQSGDYKAPTNVNAVFAFPVFTTDAVVTEDGSTIDFRQLVKVVS